MTHHINLNRDIYYEIHILLKHKFDQCIFHVKTIKFIHFLNTFYGFMLIISYYKNKITNNFKQQYRNKFVIFFL